MPYILSFTKIYNKDFDKLLNMINFAIIELISVILGGLKGENANG